MKDSKLIRHKSFKSGENIVTKGDKGTGIYYIKSGIARNVESNIYYGENCEFHYFGFLGSLNNERTSTVVAVSDVDALVIDFSIIEKNDFFYTLVHEVLKETAMIIKEKEEKIKKLEEELENLKREKK